MGPDVERAIAGEYEPQVPVPAMDSRPPGRTTLGRFFEGYGSRLLAFARFMRRARPVRGNCDTADDIQQASALLCDRVGAVSGQTHLYRLCKGFIRNVIRDRCKHDRAEKRGGGVSPVPLPTEDCMADPSADPPWRRLQSGEDGELLKAALQGIRESERRVIYMRIWRELSWREIAAELGLTSEDAARMRYERALASLERNLPGGLERADDS